MDIAKLDMEFTEDDILTWSELNQIEKKIEEVTLAIKSLNEPKVELLYNNEEVNYNNEKVYAITEEE